VHDAPSICSPCHRHHSCLVSDVGRMLLLRVRACVLCSSKAAVYLVVRSTSSPRPLTSSPHSSHGQRRTTHGAQHVCVCWCVLVCVIIVMWIAVTFGAGRNELGTEGGAGAKALAEALRHLPNLTSLDLSKCVWAMFGCSMCWA
jgi:hypothetical protein